MTPKYIYCTLSEVTIDYFVASLFFCFVFPNASGVNGATKSQYITAGYLVEIENN